MDALPAHHLECASDYCASCRTSSPARALLRCSGCKICFYCSTSCQRRDWKSHRHICRKKTAKDKKAADKESETARACRRNSCSPSTAEELAWHHFAMALFKKLEDKFWQRVSQETRQEMVESGLSIDSLYHFGEVLFLMLRLKKAVLLCCDFPRPLRERFVKEVLCPFLQEFRQHLQGGYTHLYGDGGNTQLAGAVFGPTVTAFSDLEGLPILYFKSSPPPPAQKEFTVSLDTHQQVQAPPLIPHDVPLLPLMLLEESASADVAISEVTAGASAGTGAGAGAGAGTGGGEAAATAATSPLPYQLTEACLAASLDYPLPLPEAEVQVADGSHTLAEVGYFIVHSIGGELTKVLVSTYVVASSSPQALGKVKAHFERYRSACRGIVDLRMEFGWS